MEILSFAFGMLAMIAVALVAAVVVGIVKLIKLQARYAELSNQLENLFDSLDARIDAEVRSLSDIATEDRRDRSREMSHVYSDTDTRFRDLYAYVDSRFDKLQNKLTEKKLTEKKESKELLRG